MYFSAGAPWGEYVADIEVQCPRDCGGAWRVTVTHEWDREVGFSNTVAELIEPTTCKCGPLTDDERTEIEADAEQGVADGTYSMED